MDAATAAYPAALRDYIRRALIAEVDRRLDADEAVSPAALLALLDALLRPAGLPLPPAPDDPPA